MGSNKDELINSQILIGQYNRMPQVEMVFNYYDDVVSLYKRYALRADFAVIIKTLAFKKNDFVSSLHFCVTSGELHK